MDPVHPQRARRGVVPRISTVTFPLLQDPVFCWYHAHTHDLTASQVYRGLAGAFIIDDPERDAALGLPTGVRDIPLHVFASDGGLTGMIELVTGGSYCTL